MCDHTELTAMTQIDRSEMDTQPQQVKDPLTNVRPCPSCHHLTAEGKEGERCMMGWLDLSPEHSCRSPDVNRPAVPSTGPTRVSSRL
ncbi:hypothetical protein RRG08_036943 [Elysia crispata]|uniref:Uncharacterized protein n=1 Tax=Elysia crispata TaxID=231223 RepID=A0AAE1D6H4_9GAST|nr:hypothetical protein RRG08_036943 [Elysia crispata]